MNISRDPQEAEKKDYQAIIIGGGIYGITLALEAGRRGLKTLLLEKGDFGEQTSFSSLKIIHGGLRYLQSLDLPRFRESVRERTWFLRHFPERVHPLPCFMPLYGDGMRRPSIFRAALLANHLLAPERNIGMDQDHQLPMGKVVGVQQSKTIFPLLNTEGLKGGAIWYDAYMPDSQLLVMEILLAACNLGTTPLNYVQATDLLTNKQGKIEGVAGLDRNTGTNVKYHAELVINAAGPWCRKIVKDITGDCEELFRPSLAWNVLFKRQAISNHALAVQAREPGSRLYFITPWKNRIFAGTGHEPWLGEPDNPLPTKPQLSAFIRALNLAVPGLELRLEEIDRIFAGLLPTTSVGSNELTKREVIVDHGKVGGPTGLFSVGGIKFTTARLVAKKILERTEWKKPVPSISWNTATRYPEIEKGQELEQYQELLTKDQSIIHLDDLLLRRSTLWEEGTEAMELAARLCELFPWDENRKKQELAKCRACLENSPPDKATE